MKMTDDRIAQLSELGFAWDKSKYVTKSFDEKIQDLKKYKAEYGSCNVEKKHDSKLYQFCATARHDRGSFALGAGQSRQLGSGNFRG